MTRKENGLEKFRLVKMACIVFVFCIATTIASSAQTFTAPVSFDGSNGAFPYYTSLIQGTNGGLYGLTASGGAYGGGEVFAITTAHGLTPLYSFCTLTNCTDGAGPYGALVQAANGDLYGTTTGGGANGGGTVFKVSAGGQLTTLYSFCSQTNCADGFAPVAGLVHATDGNFYGTTALGGANDSCEYGGSTYGCGIVFKITPDGSLTILHSFDGTDGFYPLWLLQGTDGRIYGTTNWGGADGYNDGTVFAINATGTLTTLHSFDGTDGSLPNWLVQASDGNFYSTTSNGGLNNTCTGGCGTVFKISRAGQFTTLYNFCSLASCADGGEPGAGLVQATDGNLYGTTYTGGANNSCDVSGSTVSCGTVFKVTTKGSLTTLHNFDPIDGFFPNGLVQATNGTLYGTTEEGGADNYGTVFSMAVGLGPFVEAEPTSGKTGSMVGILGTNLAGATSVTFNGTAATFKVISPSLIAATVPTGATTGTIEVTTPKGTLNSNGVFRVTK